MHLSDGKRSGAGFLAATEPSVGLVAVFAGGTPPEQGGLQMRRGWIRSFSLTELAALWGPG
jgi:hypothetical protein